MKRQLILLIFIISTFNINASKIYTSDITNFLIAYDSIQTTNSQSQKIKFISDLYIKNVNDELKITNLTGDFYVFTTFKMFGVKKQSANGMYLVTNEGVILFDSPWDTSPFQPLLDSIKIKHNKNVIMCIATHSHEDRTSGLDYYKRSGIKTYTTVLTDSISKENERPRAEYLIKNDTVFNIGNYKFQTFYGGEGHTKDNIVIWFDNEKILYGGCLVKSMDAKDLEYVAEANIDEWEKTIKKIQQKFKKPKFIITGHHEWSSTKVLKHTLKLINDHKKRTTEN